MACHPPLNVIFNVHYIIMQDQLGDTPLMAAIHLGHTHIFEVLVIHGANVNYRNKVRRSL